MASTKQDPLITEREGHLETDPLDPILSNLGNQDPSPNTSLIKERDDRVMIKLEGRKGNGRRRPTKSLKNSILKNFK